MTRVVSFVGEGLTVEIAVENAGRKANGYLQSESPHRVVSLHSETLVIRAGHISADTWYAAVITLLVVLLEPIG